MPENKTPAPNKTDIITPAELLGDMPKESTHADDIIEANQTAEPAGSEAPTEPASPATPAAEPKRKRGRPKGSRNAAEPAATAAPSKPIDRAALVRSVESVFTVTAAALSAGLGPHWQAAPEEKMMIAESGADYMISQGWGDFPPGVVLILALSMYALPRAFDQRTIDAIKKRKPADTKTAATIPATATAKDDENAHSHNWRIGHGQNNAGNDVSQPGGAYAKASISI